ncbi:MAG TPA: class I SAM-dependent methyltransferase [Rhodocyclaceae bacterium]|nr:class I SAM-dependent methyltransferase [Rhodocyclaceae bacterium]
MCGHRWRSAPGTTHYESQQNRNYLPTAISERKFDDRLASIRPLLREHMRILEIGCAEGLLGARIKRLLPVEYWGLEISADADTAATHLDQVLRVPAAQCHEQPFDLILSFHVLEHIDQGLEELRQWRRLLKPEGHLLLEVPNGAGHQLLMRDAHPEHAHQFSPASLALLAQRAGFQVQAISTGHFESPTYQDSLRLLATPALEEGQRRELLLQRFRERLGTGFVVCGLGGDFRNYVAPLIDDLPVAALCDGNPSNHGKRIGQQQIVAYDPAQFAGLPVLIASQRHEAEIRAALLAQGVPPANVVGLADIYDQA